MGLVTLWIETDPHQASVFLKGSLCCTAVLGTGVSALRAGSVHRGRRRGSGLGEWSRCRWKHVTRGCLLGAVIKPCDSCSLLSSATLTPVSLTARRVCFQALKIRAATRARMTLKEWPEPAVTKTTIERRRPLRSWHRCVRDKPPWALLRVRMARKRKCLPFLRAVLFTLSPSWCPREPGPLSLTTHLSYRILVYNLSCLCLS